MNVDTALLWKGIEKRLNQVPLQSRLGDEFYQRLHREFPRLVNLLRQLYGQRWDFAFQVEELVSALLESWQDRPEHLRQRDKKLPPESGWFLKNDQIGAVCYVDLWAGNLKNLQERIPYLKDLGITYLHLMPFFQVPPLENDGGYAVSSYREVRPDLGSMKDLENLGLALEKEGITLVADFVFNHTADNHLWAQKARQGDSEFQEFYWTFSDEAATREYSPWLREIFPEARRGSFTFDEKMGKWVWTTFHSYQWDLNYSNPAVFTSMAGELLHLANRGVHVLRLDAVAFIWKQAGTGCENLPQAHTLIQAFQSAVRIVAPSLLFKSEAIVHPDDILKYIDLREAQLSYNPLLMAELWEAAATREVKLLSHSLGKRSGLPVGCAWVNYLRCHDDIGWTFADEDAWEVGIKGGDHRAFLNRFYTGQFPGSFARGEPFQYNPVNGDMRICGTAASLAGLESARLQGSEIALENAINRLLLMYAVVFTAGGIPLIYLGDEIGTENDYSYKKDQGKCRDSRWLHRIPSDLKKEKEAQTNSTSSGGRIRQGFRKLVEMRKSLKALGEGKLRVWESPHPSVVFYSRGEGNEEVLILGNFSESCVELSPQWMSSHGFGKKLDRWGQTYKTGESWTLNPLQVAVFAE